MNIQTGLGLATIFNATTIKNGIVTNEKEYSILTDASPQITDDEYAKLTKEQVELRAQQIYSKLGSELEIENEPTKAIIGCGTGQKRSFTHPRKRDISIINTECVCVPPSPFYIRWLNRFGGVDYWMFQKRQTYTNKQTDITSYQSYIENYEYAFGTDYASKITAKESVIVGVENLNRLEWTELSKICYSPKVQYYNKEGGEWLDVIVTESDNDLLTDHHGIVELEIQLATPQLQV